MAGRYTYPCPSCGVRQEAQASGVFGQAPKHLPCAACEEKERLTREGAKSEQLHLRPS